MVFPHAVLSELRQLRTDLQSAAATIQRVQIVMYRLQSQSGTLNQATQRFEQARASCTQAEEQQQAMADQIAEAEQHAPDSSNSPGQPNMQFMIPRWKANQQAFARQAQECQVERAAAETQLRLEQGKMSDLEAQLDKLDRILAGFAQK